MRRPDRIEVLGFSLTVQPTVFHPQLFFSSKLLGSYVLSLPLSGLRVLDMGTGSGLIGLCAAKVGATVLAVDVNPVAVSCATENASRNNLASSIQLRESNLFAAVATTERFNYIIWNPPFYPIQAHSYEEQAWRAGTDYTVIKQFTADVRKFFLPGGKILLVASSDQDVQLIESLFLAEHFGVAKVATRRTMFETLTVYCFS